ncbi:DUF6879 family protein [Streptomyces griseoluteus]|uniref:DUF6879 family protein n=1 Tax=Streptomyces griseoluteus TaxID=29306 RepID=UPI0036CAD25E
MFDLLVPELSDEQGKRLSSEDYKRGFRERRAAIRDGEAWKLERLQHFEERNEDSREALRQGDWQAVLRLFEAERDALVRRARDDAARGVVFHRIRVVEAPLTSYVQWELHWLRLTAECGHSVRVLPASAVATAEAGSLLPELVLLDDRTLYRVLYTDAGRPDGAVCFTDPSTVRNWAQCLRELCGAAEDIEEYFDRAVAALPRHRQPDQGIDRHADRGKQARWKLADDLSGSSRDVVPAATVTGDIHFHRGAAAESSSPVPRQLPGAVNTYVNRVAELGQLNAVLAGQSGRHSVAYVHTVAGTAGAGKTSLTLRWAHQVKHQFPNGQLFVNLRGYDPGDPVTVAQALQRLLRALGVAAAELPPRHRQRGSDVPFALADRQILILLDNAATVSQVRPLLPGRGDSLVVVTSRSRLASLSVRDGTHRITLSTLPGPEAVTLLRVVTKGYRPEGDAGELAELDPPMRPSSARPADRCRASRQPPAYATRRSH